MSFTLHPQLAADTVTVGDLSCCRVLLMNNTHFPWLILVPMRANLHELFELSPPDYKQVMQEIREVSEAFSGFTKADKMNVAALGNMVSQLHIHIIARHQNDKAWPLPIWNANLPPQAYESAELSQLVGKLRRALKIAG